MVDLARETSKSTPDHEKLFKSLVEGLKYREQKARNTESHAKLTGIKIYHFCVKLLTSMHCNGLNGKW